MKVKYLLPSIIAVFFICSCEKEDVDLIETESLKASQIKIKTLTPYDPGTYQKEPARILGALVIEANSQGNNKVCHLYSLYATANKKASYDRNVTLGITATFNGIRSIVDGGTVKIPAYKSVSNNLNPILSNLTLDLSAPGRNVNIVIFKVTKAATGKVDTNYQPYLMDLGSTVNNCAQSSDPFGGFGRFNPVPGDNDFDNDGRDNNTDTDDDNDGIPDTHDDDDDNDGIPDNSDTDDDNDGVPDAGDPN